ncbi:hypothetical protein CEXT_103431 [Caerostris extrusa]|uniref:PPM-type phosphatase domain-containing protein n=1 Tax=Caerostris extrusa TaxID=172846 RepID=A0AAV4Y8N0_CAEEX|nr:hypothetical protein CEXT_103431 [Caerostris extrusa]
MVQTNRYIVRNYREFSKLSHYADQSRRISQITFERWAHRNGILKKYNKKSGKYGAIPLSTDHSPQDYAERMRIQKVGGCVRDGRVMGVIEVSRSIGDGQYKKLWNY